MTYDAKAEAMDWLRRIEREEPAVAAYYLQRAYDAGVAATERERAALVAAAQAAVKHHGCSEPDLSGDLSSQECRACALADLLDALDEAGET